MATELLLTTQSANPQQISASFCDYTNGNTLQVYKNGGTVPPNTLAVASTDYIICAEESKPLLHVWALNSQEAVKTQRFVLPDNAGCIALCPKSTYLACGIGSKIYVWELCSGKLLAVEQIHYQDVTCVKFANSGGFLLIGGKDGMIVCCSLTDLITGSKTEPLYKRMDHSLAINDICINKFGTKSRFSTVSSDQSLRIYRLITGDLLLTLIFATPLTSVIFDAQSSNVYAGGDNGTITRFKLLAPPRVLEHHLTDPEVADGTFTGHKGKITSLDINLFNNRLASASEDNNVFIWDLKSRQVLKKIEFKSPPTNVLFVLTADYMFLQSYQPRLVLSTLERSFESDLCDTVISKVQKCDVIVEKRKEAELAEKDAILGLQSQVKTLNEVSVDLFMKLHSRKS